MSNDNHDEHGRFSSGESSAAGRYGGGPKATVGAKVNIHQNLTTGAQPMRQQTMTVGKILGAGLVQTTGGRVFAAHNLVPAHMQGAFNAADRGGKFNKT